jgi:hypothetical protein
VVQGKRLMQAAFAEAYADRTEADYAALAAVVAAGRVEAVTGV